MSSGSVLDEREDYLKNPFFTKHVYGDFTPFYVTIIVCTFLAALLFLLNFVLGCCSQYNSYWQDRHTGNRWLVSLWTATPHKQPPLDFTELEEGYVPPPKPIFDTVHPDEYIELQQKRESEI